MTALRLTAEQYKAMVARARPGAGKPPPAKIKVSDFPFWPIVPGELVPISEDEFQRWVEAISASKGWTVYHTHNSKHSSPGFLDLHLARPPRYLVRELKVGSHSLTPKQRLWLSLHAQCGHDVAVWRPENRAQILTELA